MVVEVEPIDPGSLREYASVPIAFEVASRLRAIDVKGGLGFRLLEERISEPWVKDYDLLEGGIAHPLSWTTRFDVSNWGYFIARDAGVAVGGAVVAWRTPAVRMLDGRDDLAVLWDFRVAPDHRRSGIGTALFRHAVDWSRRRRCRQLKIETQDINVPACRFYEKQGCVLGGIDRFAYAGCPEVADEVMLLWYLDLESRDTYRFLTVDRCTSVLQSASRLIDSFGRRSILRRVCPGAQGAHDESI